MFSNQQIKAVEEALNNFNDGVHWIILLAMMQSGKTETFLFIASEMLRTGKIKNVIIFSGNPECELREQLIEVIEDRTDISFWDKYFDFLSTKNLNLGFSVLNKLKREITEKIIVLWGNDLNRKSCHTTDTLFIWEESHYAQSKKQNPDKFLIKLGLSANGNGNGFIDRNNYMCSVSATPFSERADNIRFNQQKATIKMYPGEGYLSVKDIRDNGKLIGFNHFNMEDILHRALTKTYNSSTPKYCIIRISHKNEEQIKSILKSVEYDWDYVIYDKLEKTSENINGKNTWDNMAKGIPPLEKNTAILIRNLCRMGKKLNKDNLGFVFETSKNPKTDTILQGLLGRICGYSENGKNVEVYISKKAIKNGEIDRYIADWDNTSSLPIIPGKGMNLTGRKIKDNSPIIPIKIKRNNLSNQRKDIINHVYHILNFSENENVLNNNNRQEYEEVKAKFNKAYNTNQSNIALNFCSKNKKTRNEEKMRLLNEAFENCIPKDFGAGCGNVDDELTIWIPKNDIHYSQDTIFITSKVKKETLTEIPQTTGREIFAQKLESNTIIEHNGILPVCLSPNSATNIQLMMTELEKIIDIANTYNTPKLITSVLDLTNNEPIGIYVNNLVLTELNKNGLIYNNIKDKFGYNLHLTKIRGPQSKKSKELGLIRLASISW